MRIRIDMSKRIDIVDKICTEFEREFQDIVVDKTIDDTWGSVDDALIQLMREANDILNGAIKKHVPESMFEEVNDDE